MKSHEIWLERKCPGVAMCPFMREDMIVIARSAAVGALELRSDPICTLKWPVPFAH